MITCELDKNWNKNVRTKITFALKLTLAVLTKTDMLKCSAPLLMGPLPRLRAILIIS